MFIAKVKAYLCILILFMLRTRAFIPKQLRINPQRLFSQKPVDKSNKKHNTHEPAVVITPRAVDYSAWYNDILAHSDMVDHSPVRGCMVIKPWGMSVWDNIRADLDERIRETGTTNAYFPLLIPKSFLAKEAEHVDGFAKECAVVTHHRLCASPDGKDLIPDPSALLEEPLVVRPTSETIIWHMFKKWIHSHRDLPLKVNQWANVLRWEMRTRPFLRTSEFLWQEGHTAHATDEEANTFAREILDMYATMCEEVLAIPVIKGEKSPCERFAGAKATYTIEAMMQNGWALQSGTSHFLGKNFAKAFEVEYQSETVERTLVSATSWGVSTRLIGAMLMCHSDDKGIVLPPQVAPTQIVIVPIIVGHNDTKNAAVLAQAHALKAMLKKHKIRAHVDDREYLRPGAKYFEWERKGVPIRLEIGPRDLENKTFNAVIRCTGEKQSLPLDEATFTTTMQTMLQTIHTTLLQQAKTRLQAHTYCMQSYEEMKAHLLQHQHQQAGGEHATGFYLVPWHCHTENEAAIKEDCKATIRCYPFEYNRTPPGPEVKCFYSGLPATHYALFARAY